MYTLYSVVRVKRGVSSVFNRQRVKAEIFRHRSEITKSSRMAVDALFWHHCASEQIQGRWGHFLPLQMLRY